MKTFTDNYRRYIFTIAAIIVFASAVLISLNYYSIKILTSIRAYVNGESEYSKAQKNATSYLIDFIQTSDVKSYHLFRKELSVPIGDSIARVGLQRRMPHSIVKKAALQGRNHPDDLDNMIWLFETFEHFAFFEEAIKKWTAGDRDIRELDNIGKFIYNLRNTQLSHSVKSALILRISTINRRLTFNQQGFSTVLGKASRFIATSLIFTNIFFILLILVTAGLFARKMFRQLIESKKEIITQNNAKSEFMSIASHELKTPLTSMKASLQILEKFAKKTPEIKEVHPFIFNANKQVNRLTDLVKDLLDVTKIQSGKLVINKSPFQINRLIQDVVEETTQSSSFNYIIKKSPELYVNADATRIYQVIDNFLSNAAKYSAGKSEIHIWAEQVPEGVKVCVKDFGPGISAGKLPLLFDRFYRIEETRHTVQGLGLGLYICKEIIENHGGKIGADSVLNQGSVFWFILPMIKILNDTNSPDLRVDEKLPETRTQVSDAESELT
jgi:signal transduction histidine kinase